MKRACVAFVGLFAVSGCHAAETQPTESAGGSVGVTATAGIGGCLSKCGPELEEFFDNGKVANLKLTFEAADLEPYGYAPDQWLDLLWEKWNSHCGPYEWMPVKMEYESPDGVGNMVMEKVGMRLRGAKSRGMNPLAGFKLDYNTLLPEGTTRRFAGLNRLEALSNEKDNSNMVQCMSYKLLRDFGILAPMCNHLRVYVNGKLYGLLESVERAKDARFLKHHFDTTDGALYAASASCGYADSLADLEYKGDTFTDEYAVAYEILRGTIADAETNLIPMLKCGDATTTPNDEDFKTCITEWIDVDQWLRLIAAESLLPTVEDFVGTRRNYFLYFQPDAAAPHGGMMRIWGWDYDTALERQACSPTSCDPFTAVAGWYGPRGIRAKLVTRLTTVYKTEYCALLNSFLNDVYDPAKVDVMAGVIEPAMTQDPVLTSDVWQTEVTKMRDFMIKHETDVRALVDQACN